jgi:DNA polymerase III subunit epsilon
VHNRRLRSAASTWTMSLKPQEEAPGKISFIDLQEADPGSDGEYYGLYRNRRAAERALEEIARANALCARVLGLEKGAGSGEAKASCFAYQLRRCRGACVGEEPARLHDTRVRLALAGIRLQPWPYAGRIGICERDWRGQEDIHVIDRWRYLGTVHSAEDAEGIRSEFVAFDPDIYRILLRFLKDPKGVRVVEIADG